MISSCPPVVDYSQALRDKAATEIYLLPPNSAIEIMLSDYAVMRAQARLCQ